MSQLVSHGAKVHVFSLWTICVCECVSERASGTLTKIAQSLSSKKPQCGYVRDLIFFVIVVFLKRQFTHKHMCMYDLHQ